MACFTLHMSSNVFASPPLEESEHQNQTYCSDVIKTVFVLRWARTEARLVTVSPSLPPPPVVVVAALFLVSHFCIALLLDKAKNGFISTHTCLRWCKSFQFSCTCTRPQSWIALQWTFITPWWWIFVGLGWNKLVRRLKGRRREDNSLLMNPQTLS